ncbi:Aromatic peroxygenase [Lecanosticta acicola]|uniref:Aromatic peroxygenase n=1 Tax=Lecanosticta acicola TaxID=111012 RepID=A0AAI9EAS7_9PEZI|nr:Aromatic peroxygenase [Lecanosticta acicola]
MKPWSLISLAAGQAAAFPQVLQHLGQSQHMPRDGSTETNCGPVPCTLFNAQEQFVDVSEASGHQWMTPTAEDQRGPCPGLNAAANHGFLPRNGILTTQQTIDGLAQAFGMAADIAAGLAVLAILLEGDPIALTWSIGGAYPSPLVDQLGEEPQGISWSHNNYEGDSSVTRQDAYLNEGDASSINLSRFQELYNSAELFTLDTLRGQFKNNQDYSISNNPYYYSAQFSGLLVVPAAHNFIINFFSNHSAEQPNGYLDRETLKSFFGITGEPGSFVANQGQERIPENWYRRPSSNQYSLAAALADVTAGYTKDPSTFKFGGNTGSTNSFVGIDVGDLTGGLFDAQNLMEGNNLGCFILLTQQQDFPDILKGLEGNVVAPITDLIGQYFTPLLDTLRCPQLESYNQGLFNQFPGYKYHPNATGTPGGLGHGTIG